jgi:hypothetical protein
MLPASPEWLMRAAVAADFTDRSKDRKEVRVHLVA